MEREVSATGEPGKHPEQQAQRRIAEEDAAAEPFEHGDAEWYAVLGED